MRSYDEAEPTHDDRPYDEQTRHRERHLAARIAKRTTLTRGSSGHPSRGAFCLFVALTALALMRPGTARADGTGEATPQPSAERIRSAADEYDRGRRAFVAGDFEQAAVHFENAYHDSPRPESLRNAIRARRSAHESARAATLAAIAAADYSDGETAKFARETLAELAPQLFGVTLTCDPECGVAADGRAISIIDRKQSVFYLDPGSHQILVSWSGERTKQASLVATAGGSQEFALVAPPLPPRPPPGEPGHVAKPLGPGFFVSGAVLAGAGVAATVIAYMAARTNPGPDTVRRDCVGLGVSCPAYQQGRAADTRTRIFFGATAGVAVVTAAVGIFFTEWQSPLTPYVAVSGTAPEGGIVGRF